MKNILIALDYDTSALKVAETGFLIAKDMNAEIIFLHSISNLDIYSSVGNIVIKGFFAGHMNINTKRAEKQIAAEELAYDFLENIKFHLGGKKIHTLVKKGKSNTIIIETAKELNADLIIIGSQSRNWSENKVIGSTTQEILNTSLIPTLVIPIMKRE